MQSDFQKYNVVIPDLDYYLDLIPCRKACPVNTHAGRYVQAIGKGDFNEAYQVAAAPNPLASVCARVCAHPCEDACRRGLLDKPVSIRALKRIACEKFGPESGQTYLPRKRPESNGIKIAIIGAGPAGIACSYYMAINGYEVTIFESTPVVGGMLYLGIPEYRLPRYVIKMEFERILHLGVELKTGWALGKDFSIQTLKDQGFQSIFIGIGTSKSKTFDIAGKHLDGVMNGIDFLINANLGYKVDLTEKVIVVGGGNVAIDIARSAIRENDNNEIDDGSATIDAARLALRLGAKEVHVVCMESWEEMPAHRYEIEEAQEEGIVFHTSRAPKKIIEKNGQVAGLEVLDVLSVFDSKGRFNPDIVENTESIIHGGNVILAIGQQLNKDSLVLDPELELNDNGTLKISSESLQTNIEGVFAGGDAVFGPRIVIDSIANGKQAARSMMNYLNPENVKSQSYHFIPMDTNSYKMPDDFERIDRVEIPQIDVNRRVGFSEVETGYTEEQARLEASRCLQCNINTIFDSDKCILCGGCVDVCPENCLRLVNYSKINSINFDDCIDETESDKFVIIKDETICIRCGLCAKRCPTQTITMEGIVFNEYTNA